ncbi:MAG TPA: OsmC family protein [Thermoanaerobaculia bacterium]|jgi:putative redox protein|nr:OsmC family protein [Thermoanaerobaculia bacterium]
MTAANDSGEGSELTSSLVKPVTDDHEWITAHVGPSGFRADITAGLHTIIADEPVALGGTGLGATPYELLLSALGACMAMTLRMYADRKGWPLESARVHLRTAAAHEKDCESCETEEVGIPRVARRIDLVGPLTDEQRKRLLQIADRCPVKQTFEKGIKIDNVTD